MRIATPYGANIESSQGSSDELQSDEKAAVRLTCWWCLPFDDACLRDSALDLSSGQVQPEDASRRARTVRGYRSDSSSCQREPAAIRTPGGL